jgi:hypothetical protein
MQVKQNFGTVQTVPNFFTRDFLPTRRNQKKPGEARRIQENSGAVRCKRNELADTPDTP